MHIINLNEIETFKWLGNTLFIAEPTDSTSMRQSPLGIVCVWLPPEVVTEMNNTAPCVTDDIEEVYFLRPAKGVFKVDHVLLAPTGEGLVIVNPQSEPALNFAEFMAKLPIEKMG
jgi:hypothetical protein